MQQYYLYIALAFFIGLIVFAIWVVRKFSKRKQLSDAQKKEFRKYFSHIKKKRSNPKEQIIDYDKLYHKILKWYGYEGTFWEILKQEPNEIWDIQKVWNLHKLRNKLVHEFDLLSVSILKKKVSEYEKELNYLMK